MINFQILKNCQKYLSVMFETNFIETLPVRLVYHQNARKCMDYDFSILTLVSVIISC